MLKNYFKIAFRNILRFKLYSFINILGLSVGIASFVLIFSYVYNELSYDTFHKNAKNIYRIYEVTKAPGNTYESRFAVTPDPLPKALQKDYPGMFKVARLFSIEFWVAHADKSFKERVYFSDPSFFDVFSFSLFEGNRESALGNPTSVVITKEFAEKMFGNNDPIGRTLKVNNYDFMVTAVLDNFPANSSIKFDVLMPAKVREKFDPGFEDKWYSSGTYTFISFSNKMTPDELRFQLSKVVDKYIPGFMRGDELRLVIEPLKAIHLDDGIEYDIVPPVSRTFLFTLVVIAVSILLISCVNFMNISTSRHTERAKEIGMRKVLGAQKSQVVKQFLCESTLMSFISMIIGIGLSELFLNQFRTLTEKQIVLYPFWEMPNILFMLGFGVLVGLIAGSYPALFLSAYTPTHVLAKKPTVGRKGIVRNILVVSQFVIASVLITSVFLMEKQVKFMEDYNMGFQPNNVVAIPMLNEAINGQFEAINAFVNQVNIHKAEGGILSAAVSENIPGDYFNNTFSVAPVGVDDKHAIKMVVSSMDENFVNTYKIKLVEGRNFSLEHGSDKTDAVIINQSAARALGWTNAVGKKIWYVHEHYPLTVIAVMKDINIASLDDAVEPMVYRYSAGGFKSIFVSAKLDPSRKAEGLSCLKRNWDKVFPASPFEYFFVKDKYDASYQPEEKIERIIEAFSALAILLAGLG
ncbi:MAG: ABC transporter permease, partial [Bacteroidota bacterium]